METLISGIMGVMEVMKSALKILIRDEKGQLSLVLVFLVVGGLIITPLLGLMTTGLITGQAYENTMHVLYAADAGVEDCLWQIKNVELADLFPDYDEYDYSRTWGYNLSEHVNDKNVDVTIANLWMPRDISAPNTTRARQIIEEGKLIITGNPSFAGGSQYEIRISYDHSCAGPGSAVVKTIGIWLPPGFEYVMGSSDLEKDSDQPYWSSANVTPYKGGYAVVWVFIPPVALADFPDSFTFEYTGPEEQSPDNAVSWIDTSGVPGITFTWDADVKVYKIISTATDPNTGKQITVESYSNRIEQRKLGSAISGDYHAVGNTLMTATGDEKYRDRLFMESSADVEEGDIPLDATIEAAWLYWSGWIEGISIPFSADSCVEDAKVNRVMFNDNPIIAATGDCQVAPTPDSGALESWSYSCYYDATNITINALDPDTKSGKFILGHRLEDGEEVYQLYDPDNPSGAPVGTTGYPLATPALSEDLQYRWSYAGWSLIIIYSSPETKGHQLYLFDDFRYVGLDTLVEFPISNFLAPDDTTGSHLTYFVGEGDNHWRTDYIKVNGYPLPQPGDPYEPFFDFNPQNNVFNSYSNSLDDPYLSVSGVDIDTFDMSECIDSGDTSADVILDNGFEIYNLVYIILSFRSEITSGGIMGYLIKI